MAAQQTKRIGNKGKVSDNNKGTYLTRENWEVMKPFVRFAFKALAVVGSALFAIVKLIPKAIEHKPEEKRGSGKIIKI